MGKSGSLAELKIYMNLIYRDQFIKNPVYFDFPEICMANIFQYLTIHQLPRMLRNPNKNNRSLIEFNSYMDYLVNCRCYSKCGVNLKFVELENSIATIAAKRSAQRSLQAAHARQTEIKKRIL